MSDLRVRPGGVTALQVGDRVTPVAIAEEAARTLASAIGLVLAVLAVPATTAIAAATVAPAVRDEPFAGE